MKTYNQHDLIKALSHLEIEEGDVLYLTGDLTLLGPSEVRQKEKVLNMFFEALSDAVGREGTIVFPTHSWEYANSQKVFDIREAKCVTGVLCEHMRKMPSCIRQDHPFSSVAAIGKNAKVICSNNGRHAYGANSPFDRMNRLKAKFLSIGLVPQKTCSQVHHCELIAGVPYRYVKEFKSNVLLDGDIINRNYYFYVTYQNMELKRDSNRKIFDHFEKKYNIATAEIGRGFLYLYSMSDFIKSTLELMSDDPYAWLLERPKQRPYNQ